MGKFEDRHSLIACTFFSYWHCFQIIVLHDGFQEYKKIFEIFFGISIVIFNGLFHSDHEAWAVEEKSASNETVPTFKLTHLWCKNH